MIKQKIITQPMWSFLANIFLCEKCTKMMYSRLGGSVFGGPRNLRPSVHDPGLNFFPSKDRNAEIEMKIRIRFH